MTTATLYRSYDLPWTLSAETERRFRQVLLRTAIVALVLSVIMPFLPVTEDATQAAFEMPPRYARLILEKKPPPKPEPKPVVKKPEPEIAAPKPELAPRPTPKPPPPPVQVAEPVPAPRPVDQARKKAAASGLLALKDQLADLRSHDAVASVTQTVSLSAGANAGVTATRAVITSGVASGSGGIVTAGLSRDTGGSALATRQTTRVSSPVAAADASGGGALTARSTTPGAKASRSREDIEMVFDRNKAAIYALYNRALRKDPTLQGKVVLKLTIAPSGQVTDCEVVSSELGDDELARKLVQRVKLFDFGARDVETVTTTKPIDFLPA